MNRTLMTGLALLGLAGCGEAKATLADAAADSAKPARVRPGSRTLVTGSTIAATMGQTITSRSNKAGETVTTTVSADVVDQSGRVVVPAGSTVELTIVEIEPATNKSQSDGTLTLQVTGVTVHGRQYPVSAQLTEVEHSLKGRGVTVGEIEKVAVGTAIGAVAGRVIGGNAKGTIIGGAIGAVGGTVVAVHTASRDVVVTAGTPVLITLTGPLTVAPAVIAKN